MAPPKPAPPPPVNPLPLPLLPPPPPPPPPPPLAAAPAANTAAPHVAAPTAAAPARARATNTSTAPAINNHCRCSKAGCVSVAPVKECFVKECKRMFCVDRVQNLISKHSLAALQIDNNLVHFCTKKHYDVLSSQLAEHHPGSTRTTWFNDGKKGWTDTVSSHAIIMQWLSAEGNYASYRGNKFGKRKIDICAEVASQINDAGVIKNRTATEVKGKIEHMERQYRAADAFIHTETGQGLRSRQDGTFETAVKRRCPHYYELDGIFRDRAGNNPPATSETIDIDDASDSQSGANTTTPRKKKAKTTGVHEILTDLVVDLRKAANESLAEKMRHNKAMEKAAVEVATAKTDMSDTELTVSNVSLFKDFLETKKDMVNSEMLFKLFPAFKQFDGYDKPTRGKGNSDK